MFKAQLSLDDPKVPINLLAKDNLFLQFVSFLTASLSFSAFSFSP